MTLLPSIAMCEEHPLLLELTNTCEKFNIHPGKAHLAFEIYTELCEVQKLWQVDHHFNENLSRFYFTAKQEKDSETHDIYIPIEREEAISPEYIDVLQAELSPHNKTLILTFKDSDSSSTYYRVTSGLIRPDSPKAAQKKKAEEKRKAFLTKQFVKNKKKLFVKLMENERSSSQ